MEELYRDLVKEEIKLRIALDGADRVGVGQPFGVLLSLRFTHSVDQRDGRFRQVPAEWRLCAGGQFVPADRLPGPGAEGDRSGADAAVRCRCDRLLRPFMPARGVEEGKAGWLEKPMAYVVLTRKDPVVDKVPSVVLDMQFTDQTDRDACAAKQHAAPGSGGRARCAAR